jgi:hypothetical protein
MSKDLLKVIQIFYFLSFGKAMDCELEAGVRFVAGAKKFHPVS